MCFPEWDESLPHRTWFMNEDCILLSSQDRPRGTGLRCERQKIRVKHIMHSDSVRKRTWRMSTQNRVRNPIASVVCLLSEPLLVYGNKTSDQQLLDEWISHPFYSPKWQPLIHIHTPTTESTMQGDSQLSRKQELGVSLRNTSTPQPGIQLATFWSQVNRLYLLSNCRSTS